MTYKFDPIHFNGTIFDLDETACMDVGSMDYIRQNQPIPASYFPRHLTFVAASSRLPDMFHLSRGIFVVSERARLVMERWAPGQVEFIPAACEAKPSIAAMLKFDSAYYFINLLGRAQRLQWLEMPTQKYQFRAKDGAGLYGLAHDYREWKLRDRTLGEPLIWHDVPWRKGNQEYTGHDEALIEDVFWRELDANFPDQLHPLRAGEG